jgi:hypothetical protein
VRQAGRQGRAAAAAAAAAKGRAEKPLSPRPHPRIMTTATPTRRCGTSASASARAGGRPTATTTTDPATLHSPPPPLASPTCAPPPRATFRFRFPFCAPRIALICCLPRQGSDGGFGRDGGGREKQSARERERESRTGPSAACRPCGWACRGSSRPLTSSRLGGQQGDESPEAAWRVRVLGRRRAGPPRGVLPAGGCGGGGGRRRLRRGQGQPRPRRRWAVDSLSCSFLFHFF